MRSYGWVRGGILQSERRPYAETHSDHDAISDYGGGRPDEWAFPPREPKKYRRRWLQSLNAGGRENPWPRGRLRRTAERGSSDDRRRRFVYPSPNPQAVFLNFPYDLKFRKLYLGYIAGVCSSGLAPRATLWQPSSFWPAPSRSARIGTCTASSPSASSRRSTELWMA